MSATKSDNTPPAHSNPIALKNDTLRGVFNSKNRITVASGTTIAPIIIIPGSRLKFVNSRQPSQSKKYTPNRNSNTRMKNHGLGHPVTASSIGGVVFEVPQMKYSSVSSWLRFLKTSENIPLRL